jgi:type IV fimbrial biogenesis protein FimT
MHNMQTPLATKNTGFSLLELIISISISAILTTAAVPGFSHLKASSDAKTVSLKLSRTLAKARSHAIFHTENVTLCGIDEMSECSSTQFDTLAVFIDDNENRIIDNDEQIVFQATMNYGGQLNLRASLRRQYIQFTSTGSSRQTGSFIYCDPNHTTVARRITISMSGRVYSGKDEDGDGIVELTNGNPIQCS